MRRLHKWGSQVWVHTLEGTKLDGWSKIGKWIGFEETSNGHQIYWPNKRSVTIERSIKFSNGNKIFAPILVAKPIQGEDEPTNLQNNPEIKSDISSPSKDQELTHNLEQNPDNPFTDQAEMDDPNQRQPVTIFFLCSF